VSLADIEPSLCKLLNQKEKWRGSSEHMRSACSTGTAKQWEFLTVFMSNSTRITIGRKAEAAGLKGLHQA
jgi:hypothetical protein